MENRENVYPVFQYCVHQNVAVMRHQLACSTDTPNTTFTGEVYKTIGSILQFLAESIGSVRIVLANKLSDIKQI